MKIKVGAKNRAFAVKNISAGFKLYLGTTTKNMGWDGHSFKKDVLLDDRIFRSELMLELWK